MKKKLVMIGNGMAGVRTIEEILKIYHQINSKLLFLDKSHTQTTTALNYPISFKGIQTLKRLLSIL